MKKKTKYPNEKNLRLSEWTSAGPEKIAAVKKRNEIWRQQKKAAKFTTRLSTEDFEGFKRVALSKRIPYQTLLASIIHAYINGSLVDIEEVRKILPKAFKTKKGA